MVRMKVMDMLDETPEGMVLSQMVDGLADMHDSPTKNELIKILRSMVVEGEIESTPEGDRMRYTLRLDAQAPPALSPQQLRCQRMEGPQ